METLPDTSWSPNAPAADTVPHMAQRTATRLAPPLLPWTSPVWEPPGNYRTFSQAAPPHRILVVGWELRDLWQDLKKDPLLQLKFANWDNFHQALAWRPSTIVYSADHSVAPPVVGAMIPEAPPTFVAVGSDLKNLLRALANGADAVFQIQAKQLHTSGPFEPSLLLERLIRKRTHSSLAKALKQGIRRAPPHSRVLPDGGLLLQVRGILTSESFVEQGDLSSIRLPPPNHLGRFDEEWSRAERVFTIMNAGHIGPTPCHPWPAVQRYLAAFPEEHLKIAERYPQRAFQALQLLTVEPRSADLARNNPIVFWMLAHEMQKVGYWPALVGKLSITKQRIVLGKLMVQPGPTSARTVKICTRIQLPFPVLPEHIRKLRWALATESCKQAFSHWQRIPLHLFVMGDDRIAHSRWLRDAAEQGEDIPVDRIQPLWQDTLHLAEQLGHDPVRVQQCEHRTEIVQLHNAWTRELNLRPAATDRPRRQFPDPPFPGNDQIQPITDSDALSQEGREVHHCVGIYASRIISGRVAIYSVLQPERATLELVFHAGMEWRIGQLVGFQNRPVQDETLHAVQSWLTQTRRRNEQEATEEPSLPDPPRQRPGWFPDGFGDPTDLPHGIMLLLVFRTLHSLVF